MTIEEWLSLKKGDVIVETASGVERTIVSVKRHFTGRTTRIWISLVKLHKSWTKSRLTHYTQYDDRGRWRLKK